MQHLEKLSVSIGQLNPASASNNSNKTDQQKKENEDRWQKAKSEESESSDKSKDSTKDISEKRRRLTRQSGLKNEEALLWSDQKIKGNLTEKPVKSRLQLAKPV